MRTSALNARRADLVEKLVTAVLDAGWVPPSCLIGDTVGGVKDLHSRFTALLASRWQT